MSKACAIGTKISISECGFDEKWLEDRIRENPAILGLGDELKVVDQQRSQPSGGRLDLLLEDRSEDEGAMYELELMLGATDESHIIRTIEYCDNEKRKWPQRSHTAVIVAEQITRRFFNVIRLLSDVMRVVAIQVNMIEADGKRTLFFSTVLDIYEEPETELEIKVADEGYWKQNAPETLEMAKRLQKLLAKEGGPFTLGMTKGYIDLTVDDDSWVWLHERAKGRSRLNFWVTGPRVPKAVSLLKQSPFVFKQKPWKDGTMLFFILGLDDISPNAKLLRSLCRLGQSSVKAWQSQD